LEAETPDYLIDFGSSLGGIARFFVINLPKNFLLRGGSGAAFGRYLSVALRQLTSRESPHHGKAQRMKKPGDPERELILIIRHILAGRKPRKHRPRPASLRIYRSES
jgi:hypothetical protein